ncbi:uncharacterized protein G2W53_011646 [Senna tora]|uniref:Uncharacterized protein n=1 Tax=Senna tora TaxID=362788 RepID=A0A834X384_9FABA|nr:uncharacterized protein G2W53_011646 [Senna tora]
MVGRDLLKERMRKSIGNGVEKVCDLMNAEGEGWNEEILNALFDAATCQYIRCIPPNREQEGDKWIWENDMSGIYTVKSGYRSAMLESWSQFDFGLDIDAEATSRFWKRLWKLPILSRYKLFLWRVCWGIIPTIETLENRGMSINEPCIMCKGAPEDVFHALVDCPELQYMWVVANYDYSSRLYHASVLERLVVEAGSWKDEQLCMLAIALYWAWNRRNKKKFENEVIRVEGLWAKVERSMEEIQSAVLNDDLNRTMPSLTWEKPEYPCVKLNVDAAASKEGGGTLGGVIRDAEGCCLGAFMGSVPCPNDPVILEAMAVRKGLEVALKAGCTHVLVEGDALLVYEMLKTPCKQASALNSLCRDILLFSSKFQFCNFQWIPRICNLAADFLSRKAKVDNRDLVWTDSVPLFLSEVLFNDQ